MAGIRFLSLIVIALLAVGCAHVPVEKKKPAAMIGKTARVRTTAYTHTEAGGRSNAIGRRLSYGEVKSAASDWSRFPVGTKFVIIQTGETRIIDDYGSALAGTNTIDLYMPTRGSMRNWGVRQVDIRILEWGSARRSLEILNPRQGNRHVRKMVLALRRQSEGMPEQFILQNPS